MSIVVGAVWEEGVLKPTAPLDLPENSRVRVTVDVSAMSTLAEDLTAIRARIVASGRPLLDDDEVLAQVQANRGGYDHKDLP